MAWNASRVSNNTLLWNAWKRAKIIAYNTTKGVVSIEEIYISQYDNVVRDYEHPDLAYKISIGGIGTAVGFSPEEAFLKIKKILQDRGIDKDWY